MRLSSLFTALTLLSLVSCGGTKSPEEEEEHSPLPLPATQAVVTTQEEEVPETPVEVAIVSDLPKLEEGATKDLSQVGEWKRRSPVEQLPSQQDLVPSLAPLPEPESPDNVSSLTEDLSRPLVVQP